MSFEVGDDVIVLEKTRDDKWKGRANKKEGFFPPDAIQNLWMPLGTSQGPSAVKEAAEISQTEQSGEVSDSKKEHVDAEEGSANTEAKEPVAALSIRSSSEENQSDKSCQGAVQVSSAKRQVCKRLARLSSTVVH